MRAPGNFVSLCRWLLFVSIVAAAPQASANRDQVIDDASSVPRVRALLMSTLKDAGGTATGAIARWRASDGREYQVAVGTTMDGGMPIDEDTAFQWGSITKVWTGALLGKLIQDGRVTLDDPLSRWLPELLGKPSGAITLRQLTTHTSGLPVQPEGFGFLVDWLTHPRDPYFPFTESRAIEFVASWQRPAHTTTYNYSNLGVGLLGIALARASAMPIERLLAEKVLTPGGAAHAWVSSAQRPARVVQAAGHGVDGNPGWGWHIGGIAAAGAAHGSAKELLNLVVATQLQVNPFDAGSTRPLWERGAVDNPRVPHAVAMGWFRRNHPSGVVVGHSGATRGYSAHAFFHESNGRAMVVLFNGSNIHAKPLLNIVADPTAPMADTIDNESINGIWNPWATSGVVLAWCAAWLFAWQRGRAPGAANSSSRTSLVLRASAALAVSTAALATLPPWGLARTPALVQAACALALLATVVWVTTRSWTHVGWWHPTQPVRRAIGGVVALAPKLLVAGFVWQIAMR